MTTKNDVSNSTDVAREANKSVFADDALHDITSMQDAFDLLSQSSVNTESFEDYGNGFTQLDKDEKSQLVKKPFVILEWRFSPSEHDKNREFVSMLLVTKDGGKFIVIDGSTGICDQLRKVTDARIANGRPNPQSGLIVEKGLRVSEYPNPAPDAPEGSKSRTYYLAN